MPKPLGYSQLDLPMYQSHHLHGDWQSPCGYQYSIVKVAIHSAEAEIRMDLCPTLAEAKGIEPLPDCSGLVFKTSATNQHLPNFYYSTQLLCLLFLRRLRLRSPQVPHFLPSGTRSRSQPPHQKSPLLGARLFWRFVFHICSYCSSIRHQRKKAHASV